MAIKPQYGQRQYSNHSHKVEAEKPNKPLQADEAKKSNRTLQALIEERQTQMSNLERELQFKNYVMNTNTWIWFCIKTSRAFPQAEFVWIKTKTERPKLRRRFATALEAHNSKGRFAELRSDKRRNADFDRQS